MTRAGSSLAFPLYRAATTLFSVVAPVWLGARRNAGKEDPQRIAERYGVSRQVRPAGRLIWCHGASVGEALSLLPLIEPLARRGHRILITTGTVTSAALLAERAPAGVIHQYIPLDHRPWVRRFLDHWRPDLVIWTELELWPSTLVEIGARGIPAYLVNARLSDRALRGWQRWPGLARKVLAAFTAVLAQSPEDARRFASLGAGDARSVGNLKLAAPALPADPPELDRLKTAIGTRPMWLASSIHPGEDAVVADVHGALKRRFPTLLTIVAPRHPPKAESMAATFASGGLAVAFRSRGDAIGPSTEVYLADTVGDLGTLYRVCDLVMMGKSFAVGGGQNPAEPARIGCAVVCGPDMSNFRELTATMTAAGALMQVDDTAALTELIGDLLAEPAARRRTVQRGLDFMAREGGALAATLAILEPHLANPLQSA